MIGRAMVSPGEIAFELDVGPDGLHLFPGEIQSLTGGFNPLSWVYSLQLTGPSTTTLRTLPAGRVVHLSDVVLMLVDPGRGAARCHAQVSRSN